MTIAVFLAALLGSIAIGMPVAFALLVTGVALMIHLDLFETQIIAQNLINGADSFPLLAVPFFMLAGDVMNSGGIAKRIVALAMAFAGHIRGGLGYVTIVTSCLLASLSGSAVADAAAMATLLVPMMAGAGHDKKRAAGLVAGGAVIGPIIPPSIPFIIFGVAGGVSITKLFLAGIAPGLMMGAALWITWALVTRHETVEVQPRRTWRERGRALGDGFWALMLPVIIVAGLKFGIFTPTEAAVVAAVYSLFVAMVIYRELKPKDLFGVFVRAAQTTAVVMFLVAAALVTSWLITVSDIANQVVDLVSPYTDNQTLLMLIIMLLGIAIGTSLDLTPTILILTPILMPIIKDAGIDPVYFGVIFIINGSIGLITPPVGTVLNVVCGVSKLSMDDLVRGVWPFILAEFAVLLLLVLFPSLVMVPLKFFTG